MEPSAGEDVLSEICNDPTLRDIILTYVKTENITPSENCWQEAVLGLLEKANSQQLLRDGDTVGESTLHSVTATLRRVDGLIQNIVTDHQSDLLSEADKASQLRTDLSRLVSEANDVKDDAMRVQNRFDTPYKAMTRQVCALERVHQCSDLLRYVLTLQRLCSRLLTSMGQQKMDFNDVDSTSINNALSQTNLRDLARFANVVFEIEILFENSDLAGIHAVESLRSWFTSFRMEYATQLQQQTLYALETLNQADLGAGLQAYYDLDELPIAVEEIVKSTCDSIIDTGLSALDSTDIHREAQENDGRVRHSNNHDRNPQRQPRANEAQLWSKIMHQRLEKFAQRLFRGCILIWNMQRVLAKKRDPHTQRSLLDHLVLWQTSTDLTSFQPCILFMSRMSSRTPTRNDVDICKQAWKYICIQLETMFSKACGVQSISKVIQHTKLKDFVQNDRSNTFVHKQLLSCVPFLCKRLRSTATRLFKGTKKNEQFEGHQENIQATAAVLEHNTSEIAESLGVASIGNEMELLTDLLNCLHTPITLYVSKNHQHLAALVDDVFGKHDAGILIKDDLSSYWPTIHNMKSISQSSWMKQTDLSAFVQRCDHRLAELTSIHPEYENHIPAHVVRQACDDVWMTLFRSEPTVPASGTKQQTIPIDTSTIRSLCEKYNECLLQCEVEENLLVAVGDTIVATTERFCIYMIHHADISTEALFTISDEFPNDAQMTNFQILELLQTFFYHLCRCISTIQKRLNALTDTQPNHMSTNVVNLRKIILLPCTVAIAKAARLVSYPYLYSISCALERLIEKAIDSAQSTVSRMEGHENFLETLETKVHQLCVDHLSHLPGSITSVEEDNTNINVKFLLNIRSQSCEAIATRLVFSYIRHVCLLRRLKEQQKAFLVEDLARLDIALAAFCPRQSLKEIPSTYHTLRAFRQLLFCPLDELKASLPVSRGTSQKTSDSSELIGQYLQALPPVLVLLYIAGIGDNNLLLPHEKFGISPQVYAFWMDGVVAYDLYQHNLSTTSEGQGVTNISLEQTVGGNDRIISTVHGILFDHTILQPGGRGSVCHNVHQQLLENVEQYRQQMTAKGNHMPCIEAQWLEHGARQQLRILSTNFD